MTPVLADVYEWLMFLHVVAAMTWLGGLIILTVLAALQQGGTCSTSARGWRETYNQPTVYATKYNGARLKRAGAMRTPGFGP